MNPFNCWYTSCFSLQDLGLQNEMRLLWEQHVYWTKSAVQALILNSPNKEQVLNRLLRNATDMGTILIPYYGKVRADEYSALIKSHLTIAADLVGAAIKGDNEAFNKLNEQWLQNAADIAHFWSAINPFLSQSETEEMFINHLDLLKAEVVYLIQKDYSAAIDLFDEIELQALHMADEFSLAMIKQFSYPAYYM